MEGPRIAVIGATGAVGQVFLEILEELSFSFSELRLCATTRSAGTRLMVAGTEYVVEETTSEISNQVDIVFISATTEASKHYAPLAAKHGALVIDDSSAFRMDPLVPLVVPEVNGDDLINHRGIVAIPNCSTTPLVMVLKPLVDVNPIRRVVVDTYQSVSGTGSAAVSELQKQTSQILHEEPVNPSVYPHQIAFNLFPHIDEFQENGYTKEEIKMVQETRKILALPNLSLSVTCVRVPVNIGHSEAIHIEFEHPIEPATVREILSAQAGIEILDDPNTNAYPTPMQAEGSNEVLVGRVRQDLSDPNSIALWISCDNLRKGAALNAIQIAEEVINRGLLHQ